MQPIYFDEKRYSYHIFSWPQPILSDYQQADPQTDFEKRVQQMFLQGNIYLRQEEYYLALDAFRQLQNLILTTVHPALPIDAYLNPSIRFPLDVALVDALSARAGAVLNTLPLKNYAFPDNTVGATMQLPDSVLKAILPGETAGLAVDATRLKITGAISNAGKLSQKGDWQGAAAAFSDTLKATPERGIAIRASILHDLAIASEKAGQAKETAAELATQSATLFSQAKMFDAQVDALHTLAGIQMRAGQQDGAAKTLSLAEEIVKAQNLFPVGVPLKAAAPFITAIAHSIGGSMVVGSAITLATHADSIPAAVPVSSSAPTMAAVPAAALEVESPTLMLDRFVSTLPAERTFQIYGFASSTSISLSGNLVQNVQGFLQNIAATADLGLLQWFGRSYVETVAYLPSMYLFVIPMAIGDCLVGLGNYQEAESYYTGTLVYPYINRSYEIPKLWIKLASLYLEMGDLAYRNAKDSVPDYAAARSWYEKIIKTDNTLDSASPLYSDAKFADIQNRVGIFIAGGMKPETADNPQILSKVLEASLRLRQIALGYNFFGFSATYVPPFSWEYLQNTAKYFAQQSSQIEQRYIQFKTAAENETLQRQQLDQQAEVARQTVELEKRGVREAQAGIDVANAGLNYATVQHDNAVKAQNEFATVRNELYEYTVQEAWANAASVGQDDEVKLTMTGFSYYNPSGERRSLVIQDLEARRTQITHDMEASRLQREVDSANAYIGVAQAELDQANGRLNIANQRVAIAQLQQRDAEENRDYLDMKEFSASLWFDLARNARRISQRYLDMATEIAFLTERAYNTETERGLSVIRYDYSHSATDNLMGADYLLLDLDYLTFDHVTTTKTKKAPMKRVISLADSFPVAYQQLKTTGKCYFQTDFSMFDRQNPGMYLSKLRNAELLFVGISADAISGALRNIGVSKFRDSGGNVITRLYPADVMPITRYDLRQDALAFRVNPNDLRLFENNGIDTLWQLDLPLSANDFDYDEILDVQLVLYYDGLFDPTLETNIRAALPANGSGTRVLSMRMSYPDELFYLKSNGQAQLMIDASFFSRTQTNLVLRKISLKLSGDAATTHGLKLHLRSQNLGAELAVTTDANGEIAGSAAGQPLFGLSGQPVFDQWTIQITATDNPGLVKDGNLVLKGLADVMAFFEYDFQYR